MKNTRVHPFKRVITFILALIMVLGAFVYFDFSSSANANQLYNANNWIGWYDSYVIDNNAYFGGLGQSGLDYLNSKNPFSVNSSGQFVVDVKDHTTGYDKSIVVNSTGSTIPVGFKMKVNINTSDGGSYYAVDGNNDVNDAFGMNYGTFSMVAMTSQVPSGTPLVNWASSISHGMYDTPGVVLTFRSAEASKNTYDYVYVYHNGVAKNIIKFADLGMKVYCNGSADTTFELRKQGTDSYAIYLSDGSVTKKIGDNLTIDDDQQLYYAVGSFPSGYGSGQGKRAVTDGSFTIKSVGSCANSSTAPSNFSGSHGHSYSWSDYGRYKMYECYGCRHMSKKGITVTYSANGGQLIGGNTAFHETNTSSTTATVPFTPSSSITATTSQPGYEFAGWSTNAAATTPDSSFSSDSNTTIHAIYVKSTYTLTLDPLGGQFEDGTTASKTYRIQNGDLYQRVVGDMPNPTKRGYRFDGWEVNGSIYGAPNWSSTASYQAFQDLTFTAKWTSINGYTLTFDTDGGTMPSRYSTSYTFYPNEKFSDIIGGYPVPTKDRHRFLGWQQEDYSANYWKNPDVFNGEGGWGTQPYTFGKNITLVAQWEEIPGYTLTLDAGEGVFSDTGDSTAQFTVPPGEKLTDNNIPFAIPQRDGYNFVGWQWNSRTDYFWTDGWGTQPYVWTEDVTFNAVWVSDHIHDVDVKNTVVFEIATGSGVYRQYDKVVCKICGDEFYGFKCSFYTRNTGLIDGNTKCLNRDVPLTEVFVDPVVSACGTYVLSEESMLTLKLKFDPFIKGASQASKALFLGWSSGAPAAYNKGLAYVAKDGYLSMICDDNYFAYYTEDCYEYVFDATYAENYTVVNGTIQPSFAKLVQENRNFGIAAIPYRGYYDQYIDYVPTMKAVSGDKLLATNTWYYQGFGLNLVNLHNYNEIRTDKVIYPGTSTGGSGATVGAPEGRLNTYYANNKGAKYVEAHYDPNYRYSGTMYYRYSRNANNQIIMFPEFTFDVRRDPSDDNPLYDATLGKHPSFLERDHEEYHKEFDWKAYFDANPTVNEVIIKDPRMYSTYLGDNDPYKFIRIVAEPHGDVYQSMGTNADGSFNIDDTDPEIREHEVYIKALHSADYQGGSYIVYKATSGDHTLPDYRLARDYTKQYNQYSSRYPLYYVYRSDHKYSNYGVTDYDNRYPTKFDRGTLTDRGFTPSGGAYEPLWAYGDGGWNCFDIVPYEANGFREEWGGFSQILQYPEPELTLIVNNPYFTAEQSMLYQYSAYQQWDNKISFNANVDADDINNSDVFGGNEAYMYTVSHGKFYMPDANLFTRDRYVITGWATTKERADEGIVDFDCGQQLDLYELGGDNEHNYVFTSFNEDGSAPTLYAVWKHIVNFTLVEGEEGYGADPFAKVTYKDAMTGSSKTVEFNETKTIKTYSGSKITVNVQPAPVGYVYSYLTLNQNTAPLRADRVITTDMNYTFNIFDDTAMTAQFAPLGITGFYIDRNNKLLGSASDDWRLYTTEASRNPVGASSDSTLDNALYYTYNDNNVFDITVSGSTYSALNGEHSDIPYDDVITLMTDAVNSSGVKFVGWQIGSSYVSYDLVYKHRVTSSETVTAVYSDTVDREPAISIVHTVTENSRDSIIAQRTAPVGYTLLETGFIITKENDADITFDDLYDENGNLNGNYYKIVSTDTDKDGVFRVILKNSTYYGIAYAYYYNDDNDIVLCVTPRFKKD